jgi:sortase (surface protein transpeptidase)
MKRYRYGHLLTILLFIVAGFGLNTAKTMAYFDTSLETVNDNPVISYSVEETMVAKIAPVASKSVSDIAVTAKIKQVTPVKTQTASAAGWTSICGGYYGYISIGGKTVCLKSTDSTAGSLSYSYGYIFNSSAYQSYNQYIFAHNSANLFGGLSGLGVGTRFAVTIQGKTTNYAVSKKVVYCDYSNPTHPCSNYSEPVLNMYDAIRPGRQGADLALMTCAGWSIGNGDATHRLMVYAKRV